jgi:3-methylornithyl-N6-L-lysine dehydrogenase
MTRLKTHDIEDIPEGLPEFDAGLTEKTGHSLLEMACHAAGVEKSAVRPLITASKIGVVPMTCGQGIISGFSQVVEAIVRHLGFDAFTTRYTDVAGMAEAALENPDILMMADDNRFIALVLKSPLVIDNGMATGKGFAAGLDLMAGGLRGERALVIGCGPVGRGAALGLIHFGAGVSVYDMDSRFSQALSEDLRRNFNAKVEVADSLGKALGSHRFIVEATNGADVIDDGDLQADSLVAAPGMPLGLTDAACEKANRVLHDPLQIGVATMAVMALAGAGKTRA